VAIVKATWAWIRGKCEEAMREVLGAGRGVQAGEVETPAMAAEAGRETRRGAERRATRRATDAMGHKIARAYGFATHTKPQGFISRLPLLRRELCKNETLRAPNLTLCISNANNSAGFIAYSALEVSIGRARRAGSF
jgi:hypothetical protein